MGISVDQSDTSMGVNEEPRSRSSPRFRVSMGISVDQRCLVGREHGRCYVAGMGISVDQRCLVGREQGHCHGPQVSRRT